MSSKIVCTSSSLFSNKNMACTKTCPHGPTPGPTPQPPPPSIPSDTEYGNPADLFTTIPTSSVTLKSPPPKKQRAAAAAASAAIASELEEEKQVNPVK